MTQKFIPHGCFFVFFLTLLFHFIPGYLRKLPVYDRRCPCNCPRLRVTTAIVTAQVTGATALINEINPLPRVLMVTAGSCIFCHITDPFFHFIRNTTGDETMTVFKKNYTLPLTCISVVLFVIALALTGFAYPYNMPLLL